MPAARTIPIMPVRTILMVISRQRSRTSKKEQSCRVSSIINIIPDIMMLLPQLHYLRGRLEELTATCEIVNEDIGVEKYLFSFIHVFLTGSPNVPCRSRSHQARVQYPQRASSLRVKCAYPRGELKFFSTYPLPQKQNNTKILCFNEKKQ